jgi:hypothetical protein
LSKYGGGYLGGHELQGFCPEPIAERDPDLLIIGDIVDNARCSGTPGLYLPHLLEIRSYEGDEVYFFDTQRRSEDGEWPVVCMGTETSGELEIVADSFVGFLRRHLR